MLRTASGPGFAQATETEINRAVGLAEEALPLFGSFDNRTRAGLLRSMAEEILALCRNLNEILACHTGRPMEEIEKSTERDCFMSPEEAKDFGIIDRVMPQRIRVIDPT